MTYEILDAIIHAVRAQERQADGLHTIADLHRNAANRALAKAVGNIQRQQGRAA